MRTEKSFASVLLSLSAACASGQGTEATNMSFVGTASGSGTLIGGVPWSYAGSGSQSFTKKSGGGSTGGGFSARSEPSWFAQSSANFSFSMTTDGVQFGTELRAAGNLPFELVQTGSVQATVAASFDFITDEIMIYSGANDPTGMFFSFASGTAYPLPNLLFPGSHTVTVHPRAIGVSTSSQRVFDRFSPMNRFIRLKPLPMGYTDRLGRASGGFCNTQLLMSPDGDAVYLSAVVTQWWENPQNSVRFLWRENQKATLVGSGPDTPLFVGASGDVVYFKTAADQIRRDSPGGSSILAWPHPATGATFVGSSATGDVVLAQIYGNEPVNPIGLWSQSSGYLPGPLLPGLVLETAWISPRAISGNGQVIVVRWDNQPEGLGLATTGHYIARVDGTSATLLGDLSPTALNSDGSIAIGSPWTGAPGTPILWQSGVTRTLPLPEGFSGAEPVFVTDDASIIVGIGFAADGSFPRLVWTGPDSVATLEEFLKKRRVDVSEMKDTAPYSNMTVVALSADGATMALADQLAADEPFLYDSRVFVVRIPPLCAADLNMDRIVDDSDFVLFAAAYNDLLCPDPLDGDCWADVNEDGFVNDDDFVLFAGAYDQLLCD